MNDTEILDIIDWYINDYDCEYYNCSYGYKIDEVNKISDPDSEKFSIIFSFTGYRSSGLCQASKSNYINWPTIQEYFREENLKKLGI